MLSTDDSEFTPDRHKTAMRGSRVSFLRPDPVDGYGPEYAGEEGYWGSQGPSKSAPTVLRPQSGLSRDIRPEDTHIYGSDHEKQGFDQLNNISL